MEGKVSQTWISVSGKEKAKLCELREVIGWSEETSDNTGQAAAGSSSTVERAPCTRGKEYGIREANARIRVCQHPHVHGSHRLAAVLQNHCTPVFAKHCQSLPGLKRAYLCTEINAFIVLQTNISCQVFFRSHRVLEKPFIALLQPNICYSALSGSKWCICLLL